MRIVKALAISILVCACILSCGVNQKHLTSASATRFAMSVLPDTYVDGGSARAITLEQRAAGAGIELSIVAQGAHGLKALYVQLDGDPAQSFSCTGDATPAFSRAAKTLSLALPDPRQPGRLYFGAVLANYPQREGFSGDGVLATLTLHPTAGAGVGRAVSSVPDDDDSAASLYMVLNDLAVWPNNQGDYDQNGEVNISDLTPLGMHFGESGPFHPEEATYVIDGDDNGELNIADITPIGMNFGDVVVSYNVYLSQDPHDYPTSNTGPNGPGAECVMFFPPSDAESTPEGRKHFLVGYVYPEPGDCLWVRPASGGQDGTPSNLYSPQGIWHLTTVTVGAIGELTGRYCSLQDVDGRPAIAYVANDRPMYVRANDENGTAWGVPVAVDSDPEAMANYLSLAMINGLPAVAYNETAHGSVAYVQASDVTGSVWGTPAEVNGRGARRAVSLAEVNLRAAVAFDQEPLNPGPYQLLYERSGNSENSDWAAISKMVYEGASFASLAVVNGNPALAFADSTVGLLYVYSTDINGSVWSDPVVVAATNGWISAGYQPQLAVMADNPAICCQVAEAPGKSAPYFMRAGDLQGAAAWSAPAPRSLDERDPCNSGAWTSMAGPAAGTYFVAYYDASNRQLRCATANDGSSCAGWHDAEVVDAGAGNDVGQYCSMAVIGGHPGIAYYDADAEALKYAVLY